ncbi:MAG TPA: glycoside hydrolase family 88 protein, partial [Lentimicrobium sp.]|nr:glycoside hydrolase family 88 protein [Lentimicrobium sp.]
MNRTILLTISSLLIVAEVFTGCQPNKNNKLDELVDQTIETSLRGMEQSVAEVGNPMLYPTYATKELKWKLDGSSNWVSGFYPGSLWKAYELSNDNRFKEWAGKWTAGIEAQKYNTNTHDLGFRFGSAFGNGLRLAPNDSATSGYKHILLTAAATADSRFFAQAGVYPSDWDANPLPNSRPMVIDVMMNLELLMWAANHGGDPEIMNRCISHALKTYKDLIREDGGSYHVVRYDKETGEVLGKGQLQGDTDSSTWSRGHAWMVYGLVVVYRYTRDPQYLDMVIKVADYFIDHLPPDQIANWDFQSNLDHRDASASAIVASALFELQDYLNTREKKKFYLEQAEKMLQSLCSAPYFSDGEETNCLLLHSTQYFGVTENTDV